MSLRLSLKTIDEAVRRKNLNGDDHILILAGSNDVKYGISPCFMSRLDALKRLFMRTNVILSNVPVRYDIPNRYQSTVKKMNSVISKSITGSFAQIMSLKELKRSDLSSQGLHYSEKGKNKICSMLVDPIKNLSFLVEEME